MGGAGPSSARSWRGRLRAPAAPGPPHLAVFGRDSHRNPVERSVNKFFSVNQNLSSKEQLGRLIERTQKHLLEQLKPFSYYSFISTTVFETIS